MRLTIPILATAILAAAGPVEAGNEQVQRGPVPDWVIPSELKPVPEGASGLMFVRRNDSQIHLDALGQAQYTGYQFKLLHPSALELGNFSVTWNPTAGAPTVHVIRVHRGGETIDVLKNASFEILRREDQLEAAKLDGILTAVLRIADLRVGDELEVGLTTRSNDPTLGGIVAGMLSLAPDPPPGRFRLGLSWDEGQEPQLKMTPDMAVLAQRRSRGVVVSLDNPAMLVPPKGAPLRYRWQRLLEYSEFPNWGAVSRQFAPLYTRAAQLGPTSQLKAEAKRIAAAHSDPLSRAKAALRLIQQEVRYVYVGLNGGNLTPVTAEETWQRRYGDCKGKTALLLALLNELGISAGPVLVSNKGVDDGLNERLPNPGIFDHVLVRASIGGVLHWLDGTLPPVAEPSPDPVLPYRWTLPLTAQGSPLQQHEWRPSDRPDRVVLFEIDARAGFGEPARITNTTIIRGIDGLREQAQLSGMSQSQLLNNLRQYAGSAVWQKIEDAQWHWDSKARASVLTISGTGTVEWRHEESGAKWLTLPGGGFRPPEKRARPAGQDQDAPYYNEPGFSCHVTTVRLPGSTQHSQWSVNANINTRIFGRNYYRAFDLREGAIRMVRGSRAEQQELDAASAERDNERIGAFDNSMAKITFEPGRRSGRAPVVSSVPATYDIDWAADGVPCLAASPAR